MIPAWQYLNESQQQDSAATAINYCKKARQLPGSKIFLGYSGRGLS